MDDQKLRSRLEQLHAELGLIDTPEQENRELLQELTRDIQGALQRKGDREGWYSGLAETLRESVARFEASHANIALLMREVIDELAYMGI
jgi:hypothetical protein